MKSKKHLMKPKMAIISLLEGNFALSTSESATNAETEAFLDEFDKGVLNLQKFVLQVVSVYLTLTLAHLRRQDSISILT